MFNKIFHRDLVPNAVKLSKIEEVIHALETAKSFDWIDGPTVSTLFDRKDRIKKEFKMVDFQINGITYWITLHWNKKKYCLSVVKPLGVDDEEEFVKQSCPVSAITTDHMGEYKNIVALIKRYETAFDNVFANAIFK